MWPSQRLASIGLDSRQGKAQTRSRDRRGIRPIVTLLEERTLLSQPGTWAIVAPLPTARESPGVTTGKDGTIYAVGGYGPAGISSEVDAYNPTTNTWRTVASLPAARYGLAAETGPNGTIYAIGGLDSNNQPSPNVYAYNPGTNVWTQTASMPTAHAFFGAAVGSNGIIYAIGGEDASTGPSSETDAYNPSTNTWTEVADLPPINYGGTDWAGRVDLTAAAGNNGTIYAIGGLVNGVGVTNSVEAYNPNTNTWTQVSYLPTPCMDLTATTGADGTIYAIGGDNSSLAINNVYACNPAIKNIWTEIASLPSARDYLAATTGIDGTIYAIGGAVDVTGVSGDPPGEVRAMPSVEIDAYTPVATPILTVTDAGGVYNATPYVAVATVNGNTSLEGVTPTLDYQQSINGVWKDLGADAPRNGGSYDVTANFAGSADYAAALSPTVEFSITPASLTISAVPDTKVYDGTTICTATPIVSGQLYGTDTMSTPTQSFLSKTVQGTQLSAIVIDPVTINDGNGGNNYNIGIFANAGTITPAPLTITAANSTKVYDGTTISTATPTVSGLVGTDTVTGLAESFTSPNVDAATLNPTYVNNTFTINDGNSGNNYTVTLDQGSGTITPDPIVIGVIPITPIRYGIINSAPNFATSLSGEPADNPDSLVVGSSVSSVVNTDSSGYWDAGNYNVGPTLSSNDGNAALFAGDYTLTSNDATLTITPATLTISATSDTKVYDGTTISTATPTVSGLVGTDTVTGLAESFTSPNVDAATLNPTYVNNTFTINDGNSGNNYTVTLDQGSGTITPDLIVIGVIPITPIRYGIINSAPNFATSLSGEPAGNPDSLVVGSSVSSVVNTDSSGYWDAGNYNVGPTLSSNDGNAALFAGDYTLTSNDATLTITPATLTISATSDTKVYDGTTISTATPTVSGLVGTDTVTGLAESFTSPNVDAATLNPTYVNNTFTINDGNSGNNYTVTLDQGSGTITPDPIVIGVIPITPIRYGIINSAPNFATSLSGEPAGNPDSLVVGSSVSSVVNTDSSGYWDAGNYNVGPTLSSNDGNAALFAGDYTLTSNDATLTITPATLTISATSDTKVYDGTTISTATPTVSGLVGTDTVTGLAESFTSPNVDAATLNPTYVNNTFTINDGNSGNNYTVTLD